MLDAASLNHTRYDLPADTRCRYRLRYRLAGGLQSAFSEPVTAVTSPAPQNHWQPVFSAGDSRERLQRPGYVRACGGHALANTPLRGRRPRAFASFTAMSGGAYLFGGVTPGHDCAFTVRTCEPVRARVRACTLTDMLAARRRLLCDRYGRTGALGGRLRVRRAAVGRAVAPRPSLAPVVRACPPHTQRALHAHGLARRTLASASGPGRDRHTAVALPLHPSRADWDPQRFRASQAERAAMHGARVDGQALFVFGGRRWLGDNVGRNDLWRARPSPLVSLATSSSGGVNFTDVQGDGTPITEASQLTLPLNAPAPTGYCVERVRVSVRLSHPQPQQLRVTLIGPGPVHGAHKFTAAATRAGVPVAAAAVLFDGPVQRGSLLQGGCALAEQVRPSRAGPSLPAAHPSLPQHVMFDSDAPPFPPVACLGAPASASLPRPPLDSLHRCAAAALARACTDHAAASWAYPLAPSGG